jgi:alkylation response protein AidB-like acyl-CoA dehydrogenase
MYWKISQAHIHPFCTHKITAAGRAIDEEQRHLTAKLWITEMHGRLVDQCLQFFGGYGFMREYEICRLYADARVLRIYGGTSEIMRELISRSL